MRPRTTVGKRPTRSSATPTSTAGTPSRTRASTSATASSSSTRRAGWRPSRTGACCSCTSATPSRPYDDRRRTAGGSQEVRRTRHDASSASPRCSPRRVRGVQKCPQPLLSVSVFDLALPYHQRLPSVRMQRRQVLLIALLVACDLSRPVAAVRLWDPVTTLPAGQGLRSSGPR